MENTVDLAIEFLRERKKTNPLCDQTWAQIGQTMAAYTNVVITDKLGNTNTALVEKDQHIAELEKQIASVRPELKLPSEKEMYKAAENFYEDNDDKPYGRVTAFLEGAKWMQKRLNPGVNFVEQK